MPMTGANMASTMLSFYSGLGFVGSNLPSFTQAVGNGTINSLLGLPFSTQDTGTLPGAGVGTGVGLVGPSDSVVSLAIFGSLVSAFGSAGADLMNLTDGMAAAFVAELGLATLNSTHAPIFLGSGTIVPGSIPAVGATIGGQIQTEGIAAGFLGTSWPDIADVVGTEFANAMALATGTVAITGSPTGPTSPGVGVGSGTIS